MKRNRITPIKKYLEIRIYTFIIRRLLSIAAQAKIYPKKRSFMQMIFISAIAESA